MVSKFTTQIISWLQREILWSNEETRLSSPQFGSQLLVSVMVGQPGYRLEEIQGNEL